MTTNDARAIAETELETAQSMGTSVSHPETEKRARLAAIILDLCHQLDALREPGPGATLRDLETIDPPTILNGPQKKAKQKKA